MKLLISALTKYIAGVVLFGALIFAPAGTLGWLNGWLMMGILFIPMMVMGIVMLCSAPELLTKRIKNKEERTTQKGVVALSGLLFIVSFIVAGLNYRYQWHALPTILPYIASVIFLIGYAMYAEVMRENAWLSRTIEVQDGQSVVSTGLYGIVRHPMYTATILMYLAMPLVLGSLVAFGIMLLYIPIIIRRINDEEQLLKTELPGYSEYCTQVRWRLIPYIY
jgi:protein-S-isoprenylcysteine O-methyltransferase Ste14